MTIKPTYEELQAQVEALKSACQLAIDMFKVNDINVPNTIETLEDAINATPQQHLAEIRAQAVSSCADKLGDAFILPHNLRKETQKAEFYKAGWRDAFLFIKQYAASIRREK